MRYFILDTVSDKGQYYFMMNASNKDAVIAAFCKAENAPESAVRAVYEIEYEYFNHESNCHFLIRQGLAVKI